MHLGVCLSSKALDYLSCQSKMDYISRPGRLHLELGHLFPGPRSRSLSSTALGAEIEHGSRYFHSAMQRGGAPSTTNDPRL